MDNKTNATDVLRDRSPIKAFLIRAAEAVLRGLTTQEARVRFGMGAALIMIRSPTN
jgi:hypothetical protein